MYSTNDFPLRLKQERKNRGWTQERLANELRTTRNTIYRWEHGDTPALFFWPDISIFLGVDIADLFAKSFDPSPQTTISESSFLNEGDTFLEKRGEGEKRIAIANDREQAMPVLRQRDMFLEEHVQLDLEQRRLEAQEKRLDMQQKWLRLVGDKIAEVLKLLDSQEDQVVQKQVSERILFSLDEFQVAHPDEFPVPTFRAIKETFEIIREEQAKALVQQTIQDSPNFSLDDIRQSLKHLDNPGQLGTSGLIHLPCVRTRFTSENITTTERGYIMRQVLFDAFERLRGSGARTDMVLDWQLYNILYYRYFKYHLKHDHIAARLGLSRSSYFRLQQEAVRALQNALLGMNAAVQVDSLIAADSV